MLYASNYPLFCKRGDRIEKNNGSLRNSDLRVEGKENTDEGRAGGCLCQDQSPGYRMHSRNHSKREGSLHADRRAESTGYLLHRGKRL